MYGTAHIRQEPGPLSPWVRQSMGHDMSENIQHGREAFMSGMSDMERMIEQNANTLCLAGFLLGTFVDRRFYLLPIAIGGLKLYRMMQEQS
jgi:hypothetical protein